MQRNPIVSIPATAQKIGISAPTVAQLLEHMRQLGILREITGRERYRLTERGQQHIQRQQEVVHPGNIDSTTTGRVALGPLPGRLGGARRTLCACQERAMQN
jgi:hypothetical protein